MKRVLVELVKKTANMTTNLRGHRDGILVEISTYVMENNYRLFFAGILLGAGFEVAKNHLTIGGISFYKVFIKNNLNRELENFEDGLKQREQRIIKSIEKLKEGNEQQGQLAAIK